jgi:hypothetical protein
LTGFLSKIFLTTAVRRRISLNAAATAGQVYEWNIKLPLEEHDELKY